MRTASKITSLLVTQLRILSRVNLNKIPSCCCAVCRFGSIVESARTYMQLHATTYNCATTNTNGYCIGDTAPAPTTSHRQVPREMIMISSCTLSPSRLMSCLGVILFSVLKRTEREETLVT